MDYRPQPGEYPAYFDNYYSRLPATPVLELLETQPGDFFRVLAGLSEEEAERAYLPGKWNTKQVLGHIMDTERIMLYRALCISRGEVQVLPGFDEDQYVAQGNFTGRTLDSLQQEYQAVRAASLAFFRNLAPEALRRQGSANNAAVTVGAIFTFLAGHEAHHQHIWQERYQPFILKPTSL